MFIEKYQPYTSLLITHNGEIIPDDDPLPLPTVVNGEYKVNLDAIGSDDVDDRENLPFTRNDITWWLVDEENDKLTKEINVGDNAGTKFTIEDSGTVSIISPSFSAPENTSLEIMCVLGKPNSLKVSEFDFNTLPNGNIVLPFTCGGGGGSTTFPTFTLVNVGEFTCDLTYAQTYAVMESYGVGEDRTIPCILSDMKWAVAYYFPNDEETHEIFPTIPETVNYGFWVADGDNPLIFYADDGNIYLPQSPK